LKTTSPFNRQHLSGRAGYFPLGRIRAGGAGQMRPLTLNLSLGLSENTIVMLYGDHGYHHNWQPLLH
jgi:hypothetical protein